MSTIVVRGRIYKGTKSGRGSVAKRLNNASRHRLFPSTLLYLKFECVFSFLCCVRAKYDICTVLCKLYVKVIVRIDEFYIKVFRTLFKYLGLHTLYMVERERKREIFV